MIHLAIPKPGIMDPGDTPIVPCGARGGGYARKPEPGEDVQWSTHLALVTCRECLAWAEGHELTYGHL